MKHDGIVLFHDTNVHERGFGIRKFWDEITVDRPHFEFLHGFGLGILAISNCYPENLDFLFKASDGTTNTIREFFLLSWQ